MNETIKRAIAAILAVMLLTCTFASCKKGDGDEDITRGVNAIEAPETSAPTTAPTTEEASSESTTEPTTAAPATNKTNTPTNNPSNSSNNSQQGGNAGNFLPELINAFGYNYDAKEGVFYTEVDSWQRSANFISEYDIAAKHANMTYVTTKIDFYYGDLSWRLQLWKGQYGVFGGAEIGVYNKSPGKTDDLYYCADDDHMMYMTYDLYLSPTDYQNGKKYFTRGWQKHWWLTGFKLGSVDPASLVMSARIRTYDSTMRDAMEKGMKNAGFREGDATTQMDTYRKSGFDFYILWYKAGNKNY